MGESVPSTSDPWPGVKKQTWVTPLARTVWLLLAVGTLITIPLTAPVLFKEFRTICLTMECAERLGSLTPAGASYLASAGISRDVYAGFNVAVVMLSSITSWAVAAIIFWRGRNKIAYLVSLTLMLLAGVNLFPFFGTGQIQFLISGVHNYLFFVTLVLAFYLFPSGRFVPRWTRYMILALFITEFFYSFFPDAPFSPHNFLPPLETGIWFTSIALIPLSQLYRYAFVSTPTERQQTKWVVGGLTFVLVVILLIAVLATAVPAERAVALRLLAHPLLTLALLAIPLSLAVGVLRYRLWDIDVIIRRTLVYTVLSTLLAAMYFATVLLLQTVIGRTAGGQSPLIIVLSTLFIATLFSPFRQRVQTIIDRRFYRRKYNTRQVLAAFASSARDDVTLEALEKDLAAVIQETLQPAEFGLWLRQEAT